MLLQLYLHFPFCKRKCLYCDFCSGQADAETVDAYCKALEKLIFHKAKQFPDAQVSTIFLGGGTPTLVPSSVMARVLDALHSAFHVLPDAEFTSEGNPGTVEKEWLDMAVSHGLNRLSLGVQAAQDPLLKRIGRIHTMEDAYRAVCMARSAGVKNLNLDAMFGLPGQTEKDYLDTLEAFRSLGAEHISAYSLILEGGTPLNRMAKEGTVLLPDEDETAAMYEKGIEWLESNGYERYEVSNFARPGFACRHNLGYWQGEWYLGLGVAAHSMLPPDEQQRRQGAVRVRYAASENVASFIHGNASEDVECITAEEAMFETMMLGLRTTFGVEESRFEKLHGISLRKRYGEQLDSLVRDELGQWKVGRFVLTPRGIEIQNDVLMRLMD